MERGNRPKIWTLGMAVAVVLFSGSILGAESGEKKTLLGTWQVNLTASEPPGFPPVQVLFTFMPGPKGNEGTLIDTNSLQLVPNPVCTPDQGVWRRTGSRTFIATHYDYCFDETTDPPGDPAGTSKIRDAITLSQDGQTFTIDQYVEGFDPAGALVFVSRLSGQGTRIEAEAPPPAP